MNVPFGAKLPWWTTLTLTPPLQDASLGPHGAGILVFKDGTLSIGLDVAGLDLECASDDTLNTCSAILSQALSELPDDAYIQTVFETGETFDPVLQAFSAQGGAGRHPLLVRGRKLRHQQFRRGAMLSRARITYYIGWKRALGHIAMQKPWWQEKYDAVQTILGRWMPRLETDLQTVRRAGRQVVDVACKVAKALRLAGIKASILDEAAVLHACHRAVNPTLWQKVAAPTFVQTAQDYEEYKGGGAFMRRAATLSAQLPLAPLHWNADKLVIGEPPMLMRAIGITGGPATTDPTFLHRLYFEHQPVDPFRIVVTHQPRNRDQAKRQLRWQRLVATGRSQEHTNFADFDQGKKKDAAAALLRRVSGNDAPRLFDTSLMVLVSGRTEAALDTATEAVTGGFIKSAASATCIQDEQLDAWLASLPGNGYRKKPDFRFLQNNCAHTLPIWLPSTGDSVPDLLFDNRQRGVTSLTVRPGAIKNRADASMQLIGKTGVGKTFLFSLLFKYGILDLGGHVLLADIKGPKDSSYRPLCEILGGHYICLRDDEEACFNPIAPRQEAFLESGELNQDTLETVTKLLLLMVLGAEPVSHGEKMDWVHVGTQVVKAMYHSQRSGRQPLVLGHVMDACGAYLKGEVSQQHRACAKEFEHRLEFFCTENRRRRLFNRPQVLDTSNPLTVFDFAGLKDDKELGALLISVMAMRIDAKLRGLPPQVPKLFGFDEAWSMFDTPQACELLERLYRTGRSTGAAACVLSQSLSDLDKCPAGEAIDDNTNLYVLGRHAPKRAAKAAARLKLSPQEHALLESLQFEENSYAEFLLRDTNTETTRVIQYFPTAFDRWCDTSSVSDVAVRKQAQEEWGLSLVETIARLAAHGPPRASKNKKAVQNMAEAEKKTKEAAA